MLTKYTGNAEVDTSKSRQIICGNCNSLLSPSMIKAGQLICPYCKEPVKIDGNLIKKLAQNSEEE